MHKVIKTRALDDVNEARGVGERGEEEASRLKSTAKSVYSGALELLVVLVKVLRDAGLRLDTQGGAESVQPLDLALALLSSEPVRASPPSLTEAERAMTQEQKQKGDGEQSS